MKLSEEQYDIIDAYLANELSAHDRALFEGDIRADTELRAEVERQQDLRLGLRALGIEQALGRAKVHYQAMASSAAASSGPEPATVRPFVRLLNTWRYWAAAASIVLLLGAGFYFFRQVAQRDEIAYADSFGTAAVNQGMKGFPTGAFPLAARPQLLDAFRNYKAGNYDRVIDQLRTLPADKQTIHYKNYFLGLTYLANQQPAEAVPLLNSARMAPGVALRQKATWFLALAYVKNGQKDKALPMLKQISTDTANPFNGLAKRVLQKIA